MIYPSAEDVLRCVTEAFETRIKPALAGHPEASTAQTIGHLLRHVGVRLEQEAKVFEQEIARLSTLTADVAVYLGDDAAPEFSSTTAMFASHADISRQVAALRERLYSQLRRLQSMDDGRKADAEYQDLRNLIRAEIGRQLAEEDMLVKAGFEGRGPRR